MKMRFDYLVAFTALSVGTLATATSIDDLVFGSVGISQAHPGKQPHGSILETRDYVDLPDECEFGFRHVTIWYLNGATKDGRKFCLVGPYNPSPPDVCRNDAYWPEEDVDDMVKVVEKQVTKDGYFKSSEVGHWSAHFAGWTSAIPDRGAMSSAFEKIIRTSRDCNVNSNACKTQNRTYYFRFDYQALWIEHEDGTWFSPWDKYCP